jgi:hypothetical protein
MDTSWRTRKVVRDVEVGTFAAMDELTKRYGPKASRNADVPPPRDTSTVPLFQRLPSEVFKTDRIMRKIGWDIFHNPHLANAVLAARHGVPRQTVTITREKMRMAPSRRHLQRRKTAMVEQLINADPTRFDRDIAREVGCTHGHVYRTRKRMGRRRERKGTAVTVTAVATS